MAGQPISRLVATPSFAQLLDDALDGAGPMPRVVPAGWAAPGVGYDARSFVFVRPLQQGQAWARAYPRPVTPPPVPPVVVAPAMSARIEPSPGLPHEAPLAAAPAPHRPVAATPAPAPSASAAPASRAGAPDRKSAGAPVAPARPAPAGQSRPTFVPARRVLTVAEQRALDRLLLLGARLDDQFSADDLRREYRKLALRLHPDRHVTAPAADRATLAEAFARATASYRCLSAVHGAAV